MSAFILNPMPYAIRKVRGKPCYKVVNKETGRVHAKCTTLERAKRQVRLLRAVDHGWKPTGSRGKSRSGGGAAVKRAHRGSDGHILVSFGGKTHKAVPVVLGKSVHYHVVTERRRK